MPSLTEDAAHGQSWWRSLDHLAETAEFREFMHREFPSGASEMLDGADRRTFLKIMGASMALAGLGLGGCRRWPEQHIVPFAGRPEGWVPGQAMHYASIMTLGGIAQPLLVTTRDGRPVKIEGNPDHPASRGATTVFAQASVLDLYDLDRSRSVRRDGEAASWETFAAWAEGHFAGVRAQRGAGLAVLAEADDSPTMRRLRARFAAELPQAMWRVWEPVNRDNANAGSQAAFGRPLRGHLRLDRAKVIVALDADILGAPFDTVRQVRGFADGRRLTDGPKSRMSRLYAVEADLSLTGANADERLALRAADVPLVAAYLAGRVTGNDAMVQQALQAADAARVLSEATTRWLDRAAEDLRATGAEALVVAGDRQGADVHVLAHAMNGALRSIGTTIVFTPETDADPRMQAIRDIAGEIIRGSIRTLVILGGNPVFTAPADLAFGDLLRRIEHSVHLSDYADETSAVARWHVNRSHALESWGDGRAWDGTYSLQQPMIEPLFAGRSTIEIVSMLLGDAKDGHTLVEETFEAAHGAGRSDPLWQRVLHDGLRTGSADPLVTPDPVTGAAAAALGRIVASRASATGQGGGYELVFAPHPALHDGRFANNGWLQELPDPLTRLTWDTAAIMSPADARELGVREGDTISIRVGDRSIEAPVTRLPGVARGTVVLPLGGGRRFEGRICAGAGFDAYAMRTTTAPDVVTGAQVSRGSAAWPLAITQDHHTIDVETIGGRLGVQQRLGSLFREADWNEYADHPDFAQHRTHVVHRLSLWDDSGLLDGAQYAWAMSIDLNACIGCGACVVACQAENNIPIVGKDQVRRNREMHWLRIDRYFRFAPQGDAHDGRFDPDRMVGVAMQPVMCMHCENAPCEQVCPVAATVHDHDGLNVMVYNRCIGTRYCSNNCPYKVRRFNYFDYHRREPVREQQGLLQVQPDYYTRRQATPDELRRLQFNPEVTVRVRGVMEKCTYCTQRIAEARIAAKNAFVQMPEAEKSARNRAGERVMIPDGTVTPACAQACPANALVFGDLKDPASRVSRLQADQRSYEMLEEIHVKARTRYLAKVRNPAGGGSHGHGHDQHGSAEPAGSGGERLTHGAGEAKGNS
ncbi:MAG: TAT-variant-translocated molybdopterin oxidoreductase [Phycisphaeraceae bacterium]|nr:TAT-variant-translocated molybdopterin oxidoreductase [Phycisphaeraceae bacterium]